MNLCGVKSLFYDVHHLTYTAFGSVYTAFVSVISHNGVDIDRDPVDYGVVYAYVYAKDIAQLLLFYNRQGFNLYDSNKCNNTNQCNGHENDILCNNSPQDVNVDYTVRIHDVSDIKNDNIVHNNN